ncbi:serpin family protein [Prevotella sp. P6B4]|uniref:serpin family protein n=1 Tax=Prevotella sp. P6B4 TaxID=1410614 RepID=UPI00049050BC|nr:serpin family protein [Prevotella sp. P6B4]
MKDNHMTRGKYLYKISGLLILLAFVVACSEGSHHEVPRDGVIRATNDFSIKLLKQLAAQNEDKDIMFSPLGIVYTLEILSNGADGETRQLIQQTLGLDSFLLSDVNAVSSMMMTTHGMGGIDKKTGANKASLNTSNLFRYNNKHEIKPDFLQTISRDYSAKCQPVEGFGSKTAELVNTLIFNGAWTEGFWTDYTKPDTFYISKDKYTIVDMMYLSDKQEHLRYTQNADYSILSMPYIGSFCMDVLLPYEDRTVEDVVNGLTMDKYNNSVKTLMKYGNIEVSFPKFGSKSQIDFNPALKAMGLGIIFTDNANFSLIDDDPIALDSIKQDIEFDLDEEGTHVEAVTTSALITVGESSNPDKVVFRVNRPFIYFIRDSFGTICFAGVYRGGK